MSRGGGYFHILYQQDGNLCGDTAFMDETYQGQESRRRVQLDCNRIESETERRSGQLSTSVRVFRASSEQPRRNKESFPR